jgi:hypothetical protein
MKFKVTQALRLDNVSYPRGVHNFSEAEVSKPHFANYLKCGYIVSLEEKMVPTLVEKPQEAEPVLEEPKEGKSKKKKKE